MAPKRPGVVGNRRWVFAGCSFDEASWSLTVDGVRIPIESKPLKVLVELLVHHGEVMTKDQLLHAIWSNVTVVEASLATAVHKLRQALGDDRHGVIETVSAIGYRIAVPVQVTTSAEPMATARSRVGTGRLLATFVALAIVLVGLAVWRWSHPTPGILALTGVQKEQLNALRKLDLPAVERLLAAGWDPNAPYDSNGNGAVNMALNNCEWDRNHDKRQMMLVVRTLIDGGADYTRRNAWGDTAYSIAKAPRYCGPDHPVTVMLHAMCNAPDNNPSDRCLASYEISRLHRN